MHKLQNLAESDQFSARIIAWQKKQGRHHLPWQNTQDPYRVWLSEIMLQQTQVVTVLDYYPRFLHHFDNVAALAAAQSDQVLSLWSGLGYYTRARNLHACAQQVMQLHQGQFPRTAQILQTLPGIGKSTAAAIAAFCFGERAAILDANVKRVLSRILAFDADLAKVANERKLWEYAETLLPTKNLVQQMPSYTQGLMDLGATVCTPKLPQCAVCPVATLCRAKAQNEVENYPVKTRKLKRSAESWWLLWAHDEKNRIWLERRPHKGIWAGLYCFPIFKSRDDLVATTQKNRALVGNVDRLELIDFCDAAMLPHVLTHKDLYLHPVQVRTNSATRLDANGAWFELSEWQKLGLPAPIRKLLLSELPLSTA